MEKLAGKVYLCKSDITRNLLRKMRIPDDVSLEFARECFKDCIENGHFRVLITGDKNNKRKQRHTAYVLDYVFYKSVIKGF